MIKFVACVSATPYAAALNTSMPTPGPRSSTVIRRPAAPSTSHPRGIRAWGAAAAAAPVPSFAFPALASFSAAAAAVCRSHTIESRSGQFADCAWSLILTYGKPTARTACEASQNGFCTALLTVVTFSIESKHDAMAPTSRPARRAQGRAAVKSVGPSWFAKGPSKHLKNEASLRWLRLSQEAGEGAGAGAEGEDGEERAAGGPQVEVTTQASHLAPRQSKSKGGLCVVSSHWRVPFGYTGYGVGMYETVRTSAKPGARSVLSRTFANSWQYLWYRYVVEEGARE